MQLDLKPCAHCGSSDGPQLYTQPNAGEGGVPRYRIACHNCGTLSDFFDLLIHGSNEETTIEKAVKAWNRRSRIRRSEDLADHVAYMRSLMQTITAGTKAKTKAAANARDAVKAMNEALDLVLHHAKAQETVEIDVNRAAR